MQWYLIALKNYINFKGRARRQEFWYFTLINLLIYFGLCFAFVITDIVHTQRYIDGESGALFFFYLNNIYGLFIFIPSIAVTIRRLHDTNHKRWWSLLFPPVAAFVEFMIALAMLSAFDPVFTAFNPAEILLTQLLSQEPLPFAMTIAFLAVIICCGILFLYLMTAKGTAGPNRFGPDPRTE